MQNTVPNVFDNIFTLYGSEPAPATHSATQNFLQTPRMIPHILQNFSKSINALEKNAQKQLREAVELNHQLVQLEQFFNAQQQTPTLRRANRNHNHRLHPYERPLVSSRTPTIQPAAPIDHHEFGFMIEQSISSQQAEFPETADFPDNNDNFLSSSQSFEYLGNTTYNTYNIEEGL
jgi:hypothetical protein